MDLMDSAIHIALLLDEEIKSAKVLNEMASLVRKERTRRIVLHIISSSPPPLYMEKLRDALVNNIAYTIIVKYEGANVKNLERLFSETGRPLYILPLNHRD
ncbi:MAG: hypothetical protein DRJ64_09055 [Thermoprotei archaeon]|nr:MAG: hypothetical protein DRJ64_09055 [Thermoprotei archaeon]